MNLEELQKFLNKMSQEKDKKGFLTEVEMQEIFEAIENIELLLKEEVQSIENQPEDKE